MKKFSISIVIPNWNGRSLLEKHLPAVLAAQKHTANSIKEIIVVDDASTDDSISFIELNFPTIVVIKNIKNRGFSFSCNTGVAHAKGNLVCLLNTDVSPRYDFCSYLLPHFDNNRVFAVSLHEEGYGYATAQFKDGFLEHAPVQEDTQSHDTFWASGGSAIFRREMWKDLHGFDSELFAPFYWEDVDISYRAQKRGWIVLWEPKSHVLHQHESSINVSNFKKTFMNNIKERNYLLWHWKNVTSPSLFRKHIIGLVTRTVLHPGYLKIILLALSKLPILIRMRHREKKETLVSDEDIFAKFVL